MWWVITECYIRVYISTFKNQLKLSGIICCLTSVIVYLTNEIYSEVDIVLTV